MKPFQLQVLLLTGWNTIIRYSKMDDAVSACDKAVSKGRVSARILEDDANNVVYEKFYNSEEYEPEPLEWQKIDF